MLVCSQVEKPAEVQEIIGQKRLRDKVSGILERIEKELDSVESKIGEAMHVLDTDNDGMVRPSLLWHACSKEHCTLKCFSAQGIAVGLACRQQSETAHPVCMHLTSPERPATLVLVYLHVLVQAQ